MIKNVLDKIKSTFENMNNKIERILQVLAGINATTGLGSLISRVGSKIS